jgi:hypothetical protein
MQQEHDGDSFVDSAFQQLQKLPRPHLLLKRHRAAGILVAYEDHHLRNYRLFYFETKATDSRNSQVQLRHLAYL